MPDAPLPAPFEAYVGQETYLFASYAHLDGAAVFPELIHLRDEGCRIWYDEGIDPGKEWPEEVAKALAGSAFFVVFISPNAVDSQNVRNEINYALNNRKPFLAIHLVETQLPPGLQLRMGDIQAIMKYRTTDEHYVRKLTKAIPTSLREKKTISYATGSTYRWWKVTMSPGGGEDVEVECIHCGLKRIYDPLFGDAPPEKCPACSFDGIQASAGPWYVTKSEGMGDRSYVCRKCKQPLFVTHYESDFQVPDQCPECGFSR